MQLPDPDQRIRLLRNSFRILAGTFFAAELIVLTGCAETTTTTQAQPKQLGLAPLQAPSGAHHHDGPHGGTVVPLGDGHVEFVYANSPPRLLLYSLGADAISAQPVAAAELSAQLKTAAGTGFETVTPAPLPQDGESAARASRFAIARELSSEFEIVLRRKTAEKTERAQALLEPAALAATTFSCPMNCEPGKTYASAGDCPVCHMALTASRQGAREHADHRPRHGGVFFMSADNWHHLEGVFAPPSEFRLYLYDNFTRPLNAGAVNAAITATADFLKADKSSATVTLQPAAGGAFLQAQVPPDCTTPPTVAVRVVFKPGGNPELFNFSFAPADAPKTR